MANYKRSMTESIMQVYLGEDNMALMKKAAGGANQTIKMKDGKLKMDSFTASAIMAVYNAVNPKNKKSMENMINSGSKSQIMKLQSLAMRQIKSGHHEEVELDEFTKKDYDENEDNNMHTENAVELARKFGSKKEFDQMVAIYKAHRKKGEISRSDQMKRDALVKKYLPKLKEEVELDEAKYDLYHKDFSSAMQHATKMAKKLHGITIDPKEIDDKVATGPSKPSSGKTNTYRLKGDKGAVQIQVYNKGGSKPFELNMYKEEVDLDEQIKYNFVVLDRLGKVVAFTSKEFDAKVHAQQGHQMDSPSKGKGIVGRNSSSAYKLKKPMSQKKGDMMINKSFDIKPGDKKIFDKGFSVKEEVELDEKIAGLVTKVKKSGMPYGILKKVYDRGMAAYKTGHRPGTTAQQWAFARVNSFTTKSAGTWGKADKDLAKQVRGESVEEEVVEAVSMAQQAAIAISKKERGEKPKKKNEDAKMNEQPEHEITVGGYTTKHFYMCGTAQKVMSKNADAEGAEEITKLQDDFYKLEKSVMDAGSATDGQKILAKEIYNKIMELAGEAGLADDIGGYMKQHLDSVEKGDPKPGFGRTDMKEEVGIDEASARADAMRAMRKDKSIDPADVDTDATDDDVKSASKNIIMQLRKSVSLRGNFPVEFMDKKKVKVSAKIAQGVQNKYNSMKKANDKEKFQAKISKSYKDMLSALKENYGNKQESTILDRVGKKLREIKNG